MLFTILGFQSWIFWDPWGIFGAIFQDFGAPDLKF